MSFKFNFYFSCEIWIKYKERERENFFISYLAGTGRTLNNWKGGSCTDPVLVTALHLIWPKVTRSPVSRLGPKARPSPSVGFEPETFWSRVKVQYHCSTLFYILKTGSKDQDKLAFENNKTVRYETKNAWKVVGD